MFDGLKRGFVFGKVAEALDSVAQGKVGGKVLGWTMSQWLVFLEGAGFFVGGAILDAFVDKLKSGEPFSVANFKATALVTGFAALAAFLRKSPTDPRRPTATVTEGQAIDIATRIKPEEPKG